MRPNPAAILSALGQAAFVWDIAGDALAWSDNVAAVFPDIPAALLTKASEFEKLIEPEPRVRLEAVAGTSAKDAGRGVSY
jgi:hypothetical protein